MNQRVKRSTKFAYICKIRRCSFGCRCLFRCNNVRRSSESDCCTRDDGTGDSRHCTTTTTPTRTTSRQLPDRFDYKTSSARADLRSPDPRWRVPAGRRFESVSERPGRTWCCTRTTRPTCSIFRELEGKQNKKLIKNQKFEIWNCWCSVSMQKKSWNETMAEHKVEKLKVEFWNERKKNE